METAAGRRVDRWIAVCAVLVAALVLIPLAVLTSVPDDDPHQRDPAAATELVAMMRAGERTDYIAEYRFTRERAGGAKLPAALTVAHWGNAVYTRAGDALGVEGAKHSYHCQIADKKASCFEVAAQHTLPPSDVIEVAAREGVYDVTKLPNDKIAGERATCYRVRSRSGRVALPGLGADALLCFGADGIPLLSVVNGAHSVDAQRATRVQRRIDDVVMTKFLADFGPAKP